jgi:HEAT repeat protein
MRIGNMKPDTRQLLDSLTALYGTCPPPDHLLAALSATSDYAAAPELLRLLGGDNPAWIRALVQTIGRIVDRMPPDRWTSLAEPLKELWTYQSYRDGSNTARYQRLIKVCSDSPSLLATINRLAAFHFSGYVREAAVAALAALHGGSELPCLLCRLNDWVLSVRTAALRVVLARLRPEYAGVFAQCLPLLVHASEGRRADLSSLMDEVRPLLARPEVRPAMHGWLRSGVRSVRRAALTALSSAADPAILEQAVLASNDPALLRDWLKTVAASSPPEVTKAVLASLRTHPIATMRRHSLDLLVALGTETESHAALEHALLDRSPLVRSTARGHRAKRGWGHFDQLYRGALDAAETSTTIAALGGIGETGNADDVGRVERYLQSPLPAVRRSALVALAMLGGESVRDVLVEHLTDESPSVVRTAARLLKPHASLVGAGRLWSIYTATTLPHTRRNVLKLLTLTSKWDSIACLLQARSRGAASVHRMDARSTQGPAAVPNPMIVALPPRRPAAAR